MKKLTSVLFIKSKRVNELIVECLNQFHSIEIIDNFKDRVDLIERFNQRNPDIFVIEIEENWEQSIDLISQINNAPFLIAISSDVLVTQKLLDSGFSDVIYSDHLTMEYFCKKISKIFKLMNSLCVKSNLLVASESNLTYIRRKGIVPQRKFIFLRHKKTSVKVYFDEILYIKNAGCDSKIYLTNKKNYFHNSSLKKFLNILPQDNFVRINNSSIINLDKIDKIDKNLLVIQNETMKISKNYYADLRRFIDNE
jgi:DNA-binding LytR/AlgR family response regulator